MNCWTQSVFLAIFIGLQSVLCQNSGVLTGSRCNREPHGLTNGKTPGDNGYKIEILGNPAKYVPGESYTVSLHGWRTPVSVQKFIGFFLAVEPSVSGSAIDSKESGTLQLLGDAWTKFSDECQNAVVHTSHGHKPEIQVMWTAPRLGSGCVKFKATIMESREIWFMDDGFLTKELCEEEQLNPDAQPEVLDECCACDEAKYEVTFQGLWSRHTHPKDFPKDHFRAHYSDIIGASHSPDYVMWEYGGNATEGLKQVAETGTTRALEAEMKDKSGSIRTIIKARGLWFPNLNGSTFAVFRVDRNNHLMSLVTMMGPSPDWIVGVSRMELCLKNCSWVFQKTMNLYPWDAGTDSGTTYLALDLPTIPQDKIRRITNIFPNNEGSPFHDPSGQPMKPVARLTLTRQRLYEKDCDSDVPLEIDFIPTPNIDDMRPECAVTDWGHYSPCSTTCGKGMKFRSRSFTISMKAKMTGCTTSLMEKTACFLRKCSSDDSEEITTIDEENCSTSEWAPWSECSVSCGKGMRTRSRNYLDKRGRKTCHKNLMERQPCMAEVQHCDQFDPQCEVTPWSEWSPCMVTCGKGFKVRTRIYTSPTALAICKLELMQKEPCMAKKADCNFDIDEAMAICSQPRDEGLCRGHFPRWYFDTTRRSCHQFSWGGCRGNQNNFQKYEDCNRVCDVMKGGDMINRINPNPVILTYAMRDSSVHVDTQHGLVCVPIDSPIVTSHGVPVQPSIHNLVPMNKAPMPIDCMVTEWSHWSPCSTTCGKGRKNRHRTIKVSPQHGGKSCPNKLAQGRKCSNRKSCN